MLAVDIGIKVGLVALLGLALLFPDLPQFAGKAMQGRVLTYGRPCCWCRPSGSSGSAAIRIRC